MDKTTEKKPEQQEEMRFYTRRMMSHISSSAQAEPEPIPEPEPEIVPEPEPEPEAISGPEPVQEPIAEPEPEPEIVPEPEKKPEPATGKPPEDKPSEVKKRKKWWIIPLILLIVVIIILLLLHSCQKQPEGEADGGNRMVWDTNAQEGGLRQRSAEEIQAELNEKVAQGMINISMNTSPVFEDGTSPGNLLIVNSESNNYPQIVYIVLKDTGEEIYRSGGIPIGSRIEYAPLSVDLEPGVYECVAYFSNADPETGDILGTAGAEITITVLN